MYKRGEILEVTIEDYAFGGKGIARIENEKGSYVIFVLNTIPGQRIKTQLTKVKRRYAEGYVVEVLEKSPDEIDLPFQPISGGPFMTLPIEKQHEYKEASTLELFRKIGEVDNISDYFDEYIESPEVYHYRNKMEYSFGCIEHDITTGEVIDDSFALGFKTRGTWWKVENLSKPSGLFDEDFESKLSQIKDWCKATGLPAWHPPKKHGFFRALLVRKSFNEDKFLIYLITSSEEIEKFDRTAFSEFMNGLLGDRIAGLFHTINNDVGDRAKVAAGNNHHLEGKTSVTEDILGLKFDISMESFFQTNPECAAKLYQKAIDYLLEDRDLNGKVIMDLFCGTGTIGQLIGSQLTESKIIGVDIVKEAIDDAKENAVRNGVPNTKFMAADVGKFLLEHPEYNGKIDAIVVDPPRAGIAPKTLRKVCRLNAERIVYISCNPATQARDIMTLKDFGYELKKMSLVDQFPHTSHVESVMLFDKK